jgi:hypothetical protein
LHLSRKGNDIDSSHGDNNHASDSIEVAALDKYLRQKESHEKAALGHGTMKPKKEIKKHEREMSKKIKTIGKKLPK